MRKQSKIRLGRRMLGAVLAAVCLTNLAGCGNKAGKNDAANNAAAKEGVYRMQDVEMGELPENGYIMSATCVDGRICMVVNENRWDELKGIVVSLITMDTDGGNREIKELFNNLEKNPDYFPEEDGMWGMEEDAAPDTGVDTGVAEDDADLDDAGADDADLDDAGADDADTDEEGQVYTNSYLDSCQIDGSGVYMILYTNSYSITPQGDYMDLGFNMTLYAYDLRGEEQFKIDINNGSDEEYFYMRGLATDRDDNLVLVGESDVRVYDKTGNMLVKIPIDLQNGYVDNVFRDKDGNVLLLVEDWGAEMQKYYIRRLDMKTGKLEDEGELPYMLMRYSIRAGVYYDLICTNNMGVYGYNIGDEEPTLLLSYINSDIDGNNMGAVMELDEEHMMTTYYDEEDWTMHMALLTHVRPEDVPDKEVIMLACHYLDWNLRRRIVAFNKESEKYRIIITDYSVYSTPEDYRAGVTKLNNDIVSGNIPDILIATEEMPLASYIAKGVLADIGKMIDNDPDMSREDYMENVFDAYSVNGKLYSVIPFFYIQTVIGKTSQVGDTPGWTLDDLKELAGRNPNSSVFGEAMSRAEMLWLIMMYSGDTYVNRDTGKCYFDTQEFRDVLEFMSSFPAEYEYNDEFWRDYETQYRSGKTLLMSLTFDNPGNFGYYAQGLFGEPVTCIGFPCKEGNGAVVSAGARYCISARSAHKEGAWEFLRYYLLDEFQNSSNVWGMPVLKSALEQKFLMAQERPYWEDENGNKEYYDQTYWIGDKEIIINPLTKEEADALYAYVSTVTMPYFYDEGLNNIITEEAESYFAGQKSLEEVTKIIQSRAQVYINESR